MNKSNSPEKAIIELWKMPATQFSMKYSDVIAEINGWEKINKSKWSKYIYQLQDSLSKAVISGELMARDDITGRYLEPGLEAYNDGSIDFQDFCDWANKAGFIGVPDDASKLAAAFGLPLEACLSKFNQVSKATTPSPAPENQATPAERIPLSVSENLEMMAMKFINYDEARRPAPLFGEGFSEEFRKLTRLSKYLKDEAWTPLEAALLVCGIEPPEDCTRTPEGQIKTPKGVPEGYWSLGGGWLTPKSIPVRDAMSILHCWKKRGNGPADVHPADFIEWCKKENINTDWLRDMPIATPPVVAIAEAAPVATPEPQAPPVVAPKRRARKPSIEAVALDYMRTEYKKNQCFQSAAAFHKHLIKTAGVDGSPFVKGTGKDGGRIFCSAASSFYDEGTLGKLWPKIRAL